MLTSMVTFPWKAQSEASLVLEGTKFSSSEAVHQKMDSKLFTTKSLWCDWVQGKLLPRGLGLPAPQRSSFLCLGGRWEASGRGAQLCPPSRCGFEGLVAEPSFEGSGCPLLSEDTEPRGLSCI